MSTDYQPGQAAVATVRGVPNVRVMRVSLAEGDEWVCSAAVDGALWARDVQVTDVRPLIVLDLEALFAGTMIVEDRSQRLIRFLREIREWDGERHAGANMHIDRLINQIERQVKPPRIPEPGWGEKVTASITTPGTYRHRQHWVGVVSDVPLHVQPEGSCLAWVSERGDRAAWSDLVDPELVTS